MAGKITVTYTEQDIKELILADLREKMPDVTIANEQIDFKVRSKQNYRDKEWENGEFMAMIDTSKLAWRR